MHLRTLLPGLLAIISFRCLQPITVSADPLDRLLPRNLIGAPPGESINGLPVNLVLDTGSSCPLLLSEDCVKRLGLKMAKAVPDDAHSVPGKPKLGLTEPCDETIFGLNFPKVSVPVYQFEAENDSEKKTVDGIIGWPFMHGEIMGFFLGDNGQFGRLANVPSKAAGWPKFPISDRDGILSLKMSPDKNAVTRVIIDTGMPAGVVLLPGQWREWKARHPAAPMTLISVNMFGDKYGYKEESWAGTFPIGESIVLHGVPVGEASAADCQLAAPGERIIVIGLAALKRMALVLDSPHHVAYAAAWVAPPPPYSHNRLGVVFIPRDNRRTEVVARVAPGSPAEVAGIQDGDILLKVNQTAIADWEAYRNLDLLKDNLNWSIPAGTKVSFTLWRGSEVIQVTAVARDILGPSSDATMRPPLPVTDNRNKP
jgi:hypothetical protein